MSETLVQQLSAWLAATDIHLLELRGPDVHIRLRRTGARIEAVAADTPLDPAPAEDVAVRASSVGLFVHAHPLHEKPLATPGDPVLAGQVLGLLRIGTLLLPVTAPRSGGVVSHVAAHGSAVGYGTPLLHLACEPINPSS